MPFCEVIDPKTGDLLVRIEYYQEFDPKNPSVFQALDQRLGSLRADAKSTFKTVGFDSVSSLEPIARVESKYVLNSKIDDQRKHFGFATDQLEEIVSMRVAGLNCNVVTVCHVDSDKDEVMGTFVYNPAFPGRLRKRIAKDYAEFYYASAGLDDKGGYIHHLQTHTRPPYNAATQIGAPDGCTNNYEVLWSNWAGARRPIHVLIYGEPGAGKSHFLASFPKPILVFMFDALGKDTPYTRLGITSEITE